MRALTELVAACACAWCVLSTAPDPSKLSWPLFPSPGSGGSSGQLASNGSSAVEQVPPESFVDCVEKFLLCEHKNSLNILLSVKQCTRATSKGRGCLQGLCSPVVAPVQVAG